jgi:hypothetical protein
MAYQSHHCPATLRCSIYISVFCTLLALSVLLPFMLYVPCPFNALFPFYAFLLLRSVSFFTPQSHPTSTTQISSLFYILLVSLLLVHAICTSLLHALPLPFFSTLGCLLALPSANSSLPPASPHSVLHLLLMSSTLPDHHCNSSASLAVPPMRPASLGVILRFLGLSSS